MDSFGTISEILTTYSALRWPSIIALAIILGIAAALQPLFTRPDLPKNAPGLISGYPLLGATRYFTSRLAFTRESRLQTKTRNFSFLLGRYPIISLGGHDGRAAIFEGKDTELNLSDG